MIRRMLSLRRRRPPVDQVEQAAAAITQLSQQIDARLNQQLAAMHDELEGVKTAARETIETERKRFAELLAGRDHQIGELRGLLDMLRASDERHTAQLMALHGSLEVANDRAEQLARRASIQRRIIDDELKPQLALMRTRYQEAIEEKARAAQLATVAGLREQLYRRLCALLELEIERYRATGAELEPSPALAQFRQTIAQLERVVDQVPPAAAAIALEHLIEQAPVDQADQADQVDDARELEELSAMIEEFG